MKIPFAFALVASTASAFVVSPSSSRPSATKLYLNQKVEEAIAEAQRVCANDPSSEACRVAWDIVEELEAADSHSNPVLTANSEPDYVALMGSFDILVQKIDGKMDQLMATAQKFEELGATDPGITELGAYAWEMKQALLRAKTSLSQ